jgi:hypothetical protein
VASGNDYPNLITRASQAFEHFLLVRFIAADDDDAKLLLVFRSGRVLDAGRSGPYTPKALLGNN